MILWAISWLMISPLLEWKIWIDLVLLPSQLPTSKTTLSPPPQKKGYLPKQTPLLHHSPFFQGLRFITKNFWCHVLSFCLRQMPRKQNRLQRQKGEPICGWILELMGIKLPSFSDNFIRPYVTDVMWSEYVFLQDLFKSSTEYTMYTAVKGWNSNVCCPAMSFGCRKVGYLQQCIDGLNVCSRINGSFSVDS